MQKLFKPSEVIRRKYLLLLIRFLCQTNFSCFWYELLIQCLWDAIRCPPPLKTHVWLGVQFRVHVGNCILQPSWEPWGAGFLIEEFCWRSCRDATERWKTVERDQNSHVITMHSPWLSHSRPNVHMKVRRLQTEMPGGRGQPPICLAPARARPALPATERQWYSWTDTRRH